MIVLSWLDGSSGVISWPWEILEGTTHSSAHHAGLIAKFSARYIVVWRALLCTTSYGYSYICNQYAAYMMAPEGVSNTSVLLRRLCEDNLRCIVGRKLGILEVESIMR
jgi:hypothetical protein